MKDVGERSCWLFTVYVKMIVFATWVPIEVSPMYSLQGAKPRTTCAARRLEATSEGDEAIKGNI